MASENDISKIQNEQQDFDIDARTSSLDKIPAHIRREFEARLALENGEDAKSAGQLGYMTRAFVLGSMPYKDPKADVYTRKNGNFRLRIVAGYEGGIPYGVYPRLLISWITTEAVLTQSPYIRLGDSLSGFLRDVLEIRATGGHNGTHKRVNEQVKRTFGAMISASVTGAGNQAGKLQLRNITIADALQFDERDLKLDPNASSDTDQEENEASPENTLWVPQSADTAGQWRSTVKLSENFYRECISSPVPIDRRAIMALRRSPLAMDLYTWLSYRFSYMDRQSAPIPWASLMGQFGSNYNSDDGQAARDFKRNFLQALKLVQEVYPGANVGIENNGLVLIPSSPHIPKSKEPGRAGKKKQDELF